MDRQQLELEAWKFCAESDEAHLKELIQEYQERGFEVYPERIAPVIAGNDNIGCGSHCGVTCTVCWDDLEPPSYRVYVRHKTETN